MLADAGETCSDATGTVVTVTGTAVLLPSLVAVMLADPWATLVTKPLLLTLATVASLPDQEIERPERRLPAESAVVADSWTAAPTSRLTTAGVTFTEATAAGTTVMVAVSEPVAELPWPWATTLKRPASGVAL